MLFIDLNKLKIIKDFHFHIASAELDFDVDKSVVAQSDSLIDTFKTLIVPSPVAISYDLTIRGEGVATDEEAEDFLSAVNVISVIFFANMITEDGRQREHRLDVPEKLLPVKISKSIMKKAVNQKTINDVFNLTIRYKDLIYILCDEKTISEDIRNA